MLSLLIVIPLIYSKAKHVKENLQEEELSQKVKNWKGF
jgi:hypothetical protein